jgi:hypothetical protein
MVELGLDVVEVDGGLRETMPASLGSRTNATLQVSCRLLMRQTIRMRSQEFVIVNVLLKEFGYGVVSGPKSILGTLE